MGHIWLIGMMGTGKTTVGAIVAERLSLPLIDTDTEVMERSGRTIPELFAISEQHFRDLEAEVVAEVAAGPTAVISTGGGVVLDQANVDLMGRSGTRVLLEADGATLANRLADDTDRPLLGGRSGIDDLARSRHDRYRSAADHVIDTTSLGVHDVADEVIRCIPT
jgi:shikimate kinase